jgi:hypothetical protein
LIWLLEILLIRPFFSAADATVPVPICGKQVNNTACGSGECCSVDGWV